MSLLLCRRRVAVNASAPSGWAWPNASTDTFGRGANAPSWSNTTFYPSELFNSPIPTVYDSPNSAGFRGYVGFDGAYGGAVYTPTRVSYPIVNTPFGTKAVLQVSFPGQRNVIGALNETTNPWPVGNDQPYAVRIHGTWAGILGFEVSEDDGATWSEVVLTNGNTTATTATTNTSGANAWRVDTNVLSTSLFRVRALSWTSGEATVDVGMRGGDAPARFDAGHLIDTSSKLYVRSAFYADPEYTNNFNTGTKYFFFSQDQGNNHYTGALGGPSNETNTGTFVGTQFNGSSELNALYDGEVSQPNGVWADIEYMFIANTPGIANGIIRAWVNGQLSQEVTNVLFFRNGDSPIFTNLFVDPTFGGGLNPPPRTTFFRLAGWYRESAP